MKYFIDFEFIEGFHKPFLGKKRHFIDMISVGILCDDGREYYAISTDFNPKDADEWVKKNVIAKLPARRVDFYDSPRARQEALLWKSNKRIISDLLSFFGCGYEDGNWHAPEGVEVYGYYADYDWVLLSSLFGRMIDLPTGFPMYCRDLKQTLDEKVGSLNELAITTMLVNQATDKWVVTGPLPKQIMDLSDWTFGTKLEFVKNHPNYPKLTNEHDALSDAKWIYELYKFLQTLKP